MRKAGILIWMGVVALLGGVYFYETHHEKRAMHLEQEKKRLIDIAPSQVKEIKFKRGDQAILLERGKQDRGKEWYIKEPINTKADPKVVKGILETLASLRYKRLISSGEPKDMAQFGLDNPRLTIRVSYGDTESTIAIGNKTPIGQSYYAKMMGNSQVFTISDYVVAHLGKGLFDLRDKRLFTISSSQVKEVILWRDSKKWRFVRESGRWYLEGPKRLPASMIDQERISNIVRSFVEAEALSFENDQELAAFGLRKPKAGAIIKAQRQKEELLFGALVPDDETRIYAKTNPKGLVVTVGTWLFRDIPLHENLFQASTKP